MKQKGFTLVELIIVILLLSIVSIVGVSRFANTTTFTQRTVFDQLSLLLKTGQKAAIAQRRTLYVVQSTQDIRICYTNTNPCPDAQSLSAQNNPLTVKRQNLSLTIPSGLNFNSQGSAGTSRITIAVGSKNLFIEGGTGYVHD